MKNTSIVVLGIFLLVCLFVPEVATASVESTLQNIQTKFIGTILPVLAIIGLIMAGFSFVMGSPNARSHLTLAIIGAVVGFGAPSIVSFIRGLVQ